MRNAADISQGPRSLDRLAAIAEGSACVLLRHDLRDGSWHVDWMLAPPSNQRDVSTDHRDLVTLRLPERLDRLAAEDEMLAEPIGLHRRAYLEFEGEVSGGRGSVRRLARGRVERIAREGETVRLMLAWRDAEGGPILRQALILRAEGESADSKWIVRCASRELAAQ